MFRRQAQTARRHVNRTQVTDNKKGEEWTQISFAPDLARFGMASIDDDTTALLMKRVYDMAGTVKDIKVLLNGERLKVKNFKQVGPSHEWSIKTDSP